MAMKRTKLRLNRESIRTLHPVTLDAIRGGLDLTGNCDSATRVGDSGHGSCARDTGAASCLPGVS